MIPSPYGGGGGAREGGYQDMPNDGYGESAGYGKAGFGGSYGGDYDRAMNPQEQFRQAFLQRLQDRTMQNHEEFVRQLNAKMGAVHQGGAGDGVGRFGGL